jgi:hypothetical protein
VRLVDKLPWRPNCWVVSLNVGFDEDGSIVEVVHLTHLVPPSSHIVQETTDWLQYLLDMNRKRHYD